jgi:uncharacterized protein YdbL (DUF1318 family)
MKTVTSIATVLIALLAFASFASAAESKEELQKRFKQRLPEINKLKAEGVVGETSEGYLDFVSERSSKASELVNEENGDRRNLYAIIADETGATVEVVAKRNAKRNFESAKPGEYLKEGGKWRKK